MTPNFVIKKNGEEILTAERLDWISYSAAGKVGMKMNTAPQVGYCMVTDMQVPSIEALNVLQLGTIDIKTTWTLRTEPIDRLIESNREYVKFEIAGDTYEVNIRVNNTPKPKTAPVTAQ